MIHLGPGSNGDVLEDDPEGSLVELDALPRERLCRIHQLLEHTGGRDIVLTVGHPRDR